MIESSRSFTHIDLFAGCGGISLGLYKAGWKGLFAIERSKMAFETLRYNLIYRKNHFDWPPWLPLSEHDIIDVLRNYTFELKRLRGTVDLVAGGPPCQGFSMAGRRNEQDQRNSLINSYIEFVNLVRPRLLFFENVIGFTIGFKNGNFKGEAYSNYLTRELQNLGYKVKDDLVDFSNFGVPQRRKRYILIGLSGGDPETFFEKIAKDKEDFLKTKGIEKSVNLGEAISDLKRGHGEIDSIEFKSFKSGIYGKPESTYQKLMREGRNEDLPDSHRFANHRKETIERFEYILENSQRNRSLGNDIRSKFGLKKKTIIPLDKNYPCPTLTTLPDDYIHYSEPRILTVREYARIQTFYDWFEFKDTYTTGGNRRRDEVPRYTQIGNAVPPLFAELSGVVLNAMI
jgi:DNA (cytosine-5)-methyltransferase 1